MDSRMSVAIDDIPPHFSSTDVKCRERCSINKHSSTAYTSLMLVVLPTEIV